MKEINRYVPKGFQLIKAVPELGLEVYGIYSPKVLAICYAGKRSKSDWYYRFSNVECLNKKIEQTIEGLNAAIAAKMEKKVLRTKKADVSVGDVFKASWGYDQTNIDYYQVVSVIGKMVEVCKIGSEGQDDCFMSGMCVPVVNNFIGKPFKKLAQCCEYGGEARIKINSFCSAYKMKPVAMIGNKAVYEASRYSYYA